MGGIAGRRIELQNTVIGEDQVGVQFVLVGPGPFNDLGDIGLLLGSLPNLQILSRREEAPIDLDGKLLLCQFFLEELLARTPNEEELLGVIIDNDGTPA